MPAVVPRTVLLGLGFEDRTLASVKTLVRLLRPTKIFAIQYDEAGKSEEILEALRKSNTDIEILSYESALKGHIPQLDGPALIDVTGLAKPIIFHSVRNCLRSAGSVLIAHTPARSYYPTDADMKRLLEAEERHNRQEFFEALSGILTGETGPYRSVPLLEIGADETRRNVMFAFASPKHERLLSLIDGRVIDQLEIVAPAGHTARNQVAQHIAEIAATDNASAAVTLINSDDLKKTAEFLMAGFLQ